MAANDSQWQRRMPAPPWAMRVQHTALGACCKRPRRGRGTRPLATRGLLYHAASLLQAPALRARRAPLQTISVYIPEELQPATVNGSVECHCRPLPSAAARLQAPAEGAAGPLAGGGEEGAAAEEAQGAPDTQGAPRADLTLAPPHDRAVVRETPSWPRSWAKFSPLSLYSHRNARANCSYLSGQPNTFLAPGTRQIEHVYL